MKSILVAVAATVATSVLAQQPNPNPSYTPDRPPEFSCAGGQPLDFTKEELIEKALEEITRKGGRLPPTYSMMLKRWGCDWWVFVLQDPNVPGADFGVLVDGISGTAKQFIRR